jgi:hypothetical protein
LDRQFCDTNRRILAGENPHLHFRKDGLFHVLGCDRPAASS